MSKTLTAAELAICIYLYDRPETSAYLQSVIDVHVFHGLADRAKLTAALEGLVMRGYVSYSPFLRGYKLTSQGRSELSAERSAKAF